MNRILCLVVLFTPAALFAADPPPKKLTADKVVKQWTPKLADKDDAT